MGGFPAENVPVSIAPILPANILTGFQVFTSTTAATTVITVPAGRTWVGTVLVSCGVQNAAALASAGEARGTVSVAGGGATPAAGTLFEIECVVGANAAAGTVGDGDNNSGSLPFVIAAPAANAVTVQLASVVTGSGGRVSAAAAGLLQ